MIRHRNRFPDARFYFAKLPEFLRRVFDRPVKYWGACPPGWKNWVGSLSVNEIGARQWSDTLRIAAQDGRNLPKENYCEVYYEELVDFPEAQISRIAEFAELENAEMIAYYAGTTVDRSRRDSWRRILTGSDLNAVRETLEPVMVDFGYRWDDDLLGLPPVGSELIEKSIGLR
jgi:hypothetical protein